MLLLEGPSSWSWSVSSVAPEFSQLIRVAPARHVGSSRSIHPYFGKVDPALADKLISVLSDPGDLVFDPFCGSGTVLHEAVLAGRNVVGWDSSHLAALIASAKLVGLEQTERTELEGVARYFDPYEDPNSLFGERIPNHCELPEIRRVNHIGHWFNENALKELAFIRECLRENRLNLSPVATLLATTAFSRIIVPASNQAGESTYKRKDKPNVEGRVIKLFRKAIVDVIDYADAFTQLRQAFSHDHCRKFSRIQSDHYRVDWGAITANVMARDSRTPPAYSGEKPRLVVTSPPYLMSWDYGLYHKFRFYWLDIDLDRYEDTEIGRHLRRKNDDVERYVSDMDRVFSVLWQYLDQSGRIAMVNAPSVVYGRLVDTNELLRDCGGRNGWRLVECFPTIDIPGPHHGMYASLSSRNASAPGQRGKKEHVLIFERL